MKRLLFATILVMALYSCCKAICEDGGVTIHVQNAQAVDTDTVFLIRYKPGTMFTEKIDTLKRYTNVPAGSTLPSSFMDILDYQADWKVVIPGLNKEYFIAQIETETDRCNCGGDKFRRVTKFRFNNVEKEGNSATLN